MHVAPPALQYSPRAVPFGVPDPSEVPSGAVFRSDDGRTWRQSSRGGRYLWVELQQLPLDEYQRRQRRLHQAQVFAAIAVALSVIVGWILMNAALPPAVTAYGVTLVVIVADLLLFAIAHIAITRRRTFPDHLDREQDEEEK